MADITINAAAVIASANAVISKDYTAGAAVTAGQLVYLNASSQWALMDANAAATGNNITDKRGVALGNAATNQPLVVALEDIDFTPGGTLANGTAYYASPNAGAIAPVADLGAGNYPVIALLSKSTTKAHLRFTAGGATV